MSTLDFKCDYCGRTGKLYLLKDLKQKLNEMKGE